MMRLARESAILSRLRADGVQTVHALSESVGASPATVRRDIVRLAEDGQLVRTYGGAAPIDLADTRLLDELEVNSKAKSAIARSAAAQVANDMTVMIDIGSTALHFARELKRRRVTIITGNMAVYDELDDDPIVELVLLGGRYQRQYRCLEGAITTDSLAESHADIAFIGASGVSDLGDVRDTTVNQVLIKRAMMSSAPRTVLLADSSKFPGAGASKVCDIADFDAVISEAPLSRQMSTVCAENETEVVIACD